MLTRSRPRCEASSSAKAARTAKGTCRPLQHMALRMAGMRQDSQCMICAGLETCCFVLQRLCAHAHTQARLCHPETSRSSARILWVPGGAMTTPQHSYGAGRSPRHHPSLCTTMMQSPIERSQAPQSLYNVLLVWSVRAQSLEQTQQCKAELPGTAQSRSALAVSWWGMTTAASSQKRQARSSYLQQPAATACPQQHVLACFQTVIGARTALPVRVPSPGASQGTGKEGTLSKRRGLPTLPLLERQAPLRRGNTATAAS